MQKACEREVEELHQFFEDWFNGKIAQNDDLFGRFAHVIHPDFTIVPPSAEPVARTELLERLYGAHSSSAPPRPPIKIWVEKFDVRYQDDYLLMATYEEWQEIADDVNARISTVLFKLKPDTPNGVEWLHVHETKMQT